MNITDTATSAVPVSIERTGPSPVVKAAGQMPAKTDVEAVASQVSLHATDVKTHFDAMSGILVASVVDKDTGAVVTEVPPEGLRALAARTAEFRGKLFDMKL